MDKQSEKKRNVIFSKPDRSLTIQKVINAHRNKMYKNKY